MSESQKSSTPEALSQRQKQILHFAAKGFTDRQIAHITGLSEGTIRTYWDRIRSRFDARSRTEALATHLVSVQRALKEELSAMRQILALVPTFVWMAEPSGEVVYVNEWFSKFSGYASAECLGAGCRILMPESEQSESAARWAHAQKSGEGYQAVVHFRSSHGDLRPHQIQLSPIAGEEGTARWVGCAFEVVDATGSHLDVSSPRLSEAELAQAQRLIPFQEIDSASSNSRPEEGQMDIDSDELPDGTGKFII